MLDDVDFSRMHFNILVKLSCNLIVRTHLLFKKFIRSLIVVII
jgi:hypothetical protein